MPKINRSKNLKRKKRVYVSDIHMGAGRSFKPDCGCHVYDWFGPKEAKCTFVETEKDEETRRHYVRLKSWDGKNARLMKEEYVER